MATLRMYQCFVCVLAAVAIVQVQCLDTYVHDLGKRLSELEATILRVVEQNNDLVERKNDLAERNNNLVEKTNKLTERNNDLIGRNNDLVKRNNDLVKRNNKLTESNNNLVQRNNHLEDRNNIVEERNNELAEKNNNLEKRISTKINEFRDEPQKEETFFKRQSSTAKTVAFTAVVHPMDLHNLGAGQTIIYDKVITNVGGAYHNQTGIFTAPLSGVYVFNFAVMIPPGQYEYLQLIKNGQHVMWNYGHAIGSTHLTSSSRTLTLELKAGDEVWIRTPPMAIHGNGEIHGNDYTTFSGWIVYIAS